MTKLDQIMKRYGVRLRTGPSAVRHLVHGYDTTVDPIPFAYYEAAIKASYLQQALSPDWADRQAEMERYYRRIANQDGYTLPDPSKVRPGVREKTCGLAARDYHYCCQVLAKVGLYYELLD